VLKEQHLLSFEQLLHSLAGGLSLSLFEGGLGDNSLQVKIQSISGQKPRCYHQTLTRICLKKIDKPSWHEMVVVDSLDEGLDSRSLSDLLVAHFVGHLEGGSVNASNDGMSVWLGLCSIVEGSNNNCFPSGVTAAEDDNDLSWLKAKEKTKKYD